MKELKVHQTSDLLAFSYNTQENLERSESGTLVGRVGTNGELAYLARGKAIEIVRMNDGSRRSACNLGSIRDNIVINCINEFVVGDSKKLLLGLEVIGWKRNGVICVYDISLSKVIRAIWLPQAVTALTIIENITEFETNLNALSTEHSKNLVVVGCRGGQVLLIKIGEMKTYDHQNDLSLPAELEYIKVKNLVKTNSYKTNPSANYCIDLSVDFCSDGSFRYLDPMGKLLSVFKRGNVAVTSLLPMKQASLLVAGYSFGSFQIWDMQTLQPIFSSSFSPSMADVTHLVFQEPENDPRYCCYLLVGRSPSGTTDINLPTTLTLYQLVFEIKEISDGGYFIYRDLEAVCKRFDHQLTSDSNHLADLVSIGSRIITCSTLARETKQQRLDQSTGGFSDFEGRHPDTTLSYIVWESPPQEPEKSHPSYHLGLFDINRWYQLQMPSSVGYAMYGSSDPVCPFFAFYSLSEVSETILPDNLVDCYINPKDISCFSSPVYPTLEQNFWPSAFAFKCTCLAERGIVKTEMLGMQRQILADLVSRGSEIFSRGYQLINLCWSAGLIPKLEVSRLDDPQIQFECLMSVAIEHNVMGFIMGCVRDWSRGEITNAGSCLRSILQWTWKRVIKAKGILDEHYITLFYSETSKLDDDLIRILSNCADELRRLVQILSALKDSPVSITDEGASNLTTRLTVTNCINRYADAILFFVRSDILPESTESRQINFKSPFDDNVLYIDEYCKVIEQKICENDIDDDFGWNGQYPPPSVNIVCKSLLLDVPRDALMNFLYYWILDAAEFLKSKKIAENASYFFNISKTQKNIIEASWEIDHNRLESGVERLMEFGPELLPEAMKAVYRFGNRSLACGIYKAKEMLSTGDTDWKLCIRILVENMAIYEAYKLQAKYRESDIGFELFQYFLEQCFKNNAMPKLFDLYLTEEDEDWLYEFLEQDSSPMSKELLIIFCIKRHRYAEAMKHGASFENQRWTYKDKSLFGGIPSRRAIIHMSHQMILPMQRKLISNRANYLQKELKEHMHSEPLSAAITKKDAFTVSPHSETIFRIVQSIGANRSSPEVATFDESFNLPFVRSAKTPSSRTRREYGKKKPQPEKLPTKSEKKSILKPAISESVDTGFPVKRRKHMFYGSEAMKLLQTPPVIKNPKHLKQARNLRTPASILKKSKGATEKSVRKRVVISDPNFSASPEQLPESPSKLPDSPSCLTPEIFKEDLSIAKLNDSNKNEQRNDSDQQSVDLKRNLDLDFDDKDDESALNSPMEKNNDIQNESKTDYELELPSNATKSLSETILEKDIAIIDTTGIKEAEICIAAGNESLISSGYQATQGNVPDYSQADLEMMQEMTTSEAESEDVKSVVEDDVNNLQSQTGDVVEHKKTVAFAVEPTKELMETSSSQVIHSQDVTLDFYEERHGALPEENNFAQSLASELLASEMAADDSQVDYEGNEDALDLKEENSSVGFEETNLKTQDEVGESGDQETQEEFVLELDTDSNDFVDDGSKLFDEEDARRKECDLLETEDESKETLASSEVERKEGNNVEEKTDFTEKEPEVTEEELESKKDLQVVDVEAEDVEVEDVEVEDVEVEEAAKPEEEVVVDNEVKIVEEVQDDKEIEVDKDIDVSKKPENETEGEKEKIVEKKEQVENESKSKTKTGEGENTKEDESRLELENQQKSEVKEDEGSGSAFEKEQKLKEEVESETRMEGKSELTTETKKVDDFEMTQAEKGYVAEIVAEELEEGQEESSSIIKSENVVGEEGLGEEDGKMLLIGSEKSSISEQEDKQSILRLDLPSHLKPQFSLHTPSSDLSTPGTIDSNPSLRLSDVGTPDSILTSTDLIRSNIGASGGKSLRSRRLTTGGAVEDLMKEKRGDLKVYVGSTDVTSQMKCFDSSFESQESSFVTTPSDFNNQPLKFDDLTQEREATPPKQARKSETTKLSTKKKGSEKKVETEPPIPTKTRKSQSPVKSKSRRSFHTPRRSPKDAFLYTPPVTRLSAKKGTPVAKPLQEIGENSFLSSSISESPISFTPLTSSGKKKPRDRTKRYSMQCPLVNSSHSMTLRSRNKPSGLLK